MNPLKSKLALEYDLFVYLHLFDRTWYIIYCILYTI
jgi:hypothetical protein